MAEKAIVAPGEQLKIAVILDHDDGYHSWPNKEVQLSKDINESALRTEIVIDPETTPPAVHLLGVQWPEAHPGSVPDPTLKAPTVRVPVFSGKALVYLLFDVANDAAPGDLQVPVTVSYQSCNERMCLQPQKLTLPITVRVADATASASAARNEPELFAAFDQAKIIPSSSTATPPGENGKATTSAPPTTPQPTQVVVPPRTIFGVTVGASLLLIALAAMLGGAVLNLTPCVLPIIPIKVMSLVEHAGNPRRRIVLGLWMALGVVAFWFVIGLPMAFVSSLDPTRFLFGHWWVTLGIGLLIALMGLGIMGLFAINLPQAVYMINPKADTPHGSFFFGVMAGVLGLPCFGFVAGGLLAGAAALPTLTILIIFTCIGIGMGLPYLILAARPGLIEKIPRTGPASELVKQVMGLLILAAAGLFISVAVRTLLIEKPYLSESLAYWVVAFFVFLAGAWLTLRIIAIAKSAWPKLVMPLLAVLLTLGAVWYASVSTAADRKDYELRLAGEASWQPFSKEVLQKGMADGKVVVIDFTASWCINCKVLKRTFLDREPLYSRLREGDVAILEADLTSEEDPGWEFLHSLGQTGVPTLAVYGPAIQQPIVMNSYTSQLVLDAIDRAKGGSTMTRR